MIQFFNSVFLKDLSFYVPERRVTNQDIIDAHLLRIKSDWVASRIGITERRWAEEGVAASDLAVSAICGLQQKIWQGALWVSTISPDFLTPSTASILKGKLGLHHFYPAFDLSAACAGHIFALEQAAMRLQNTNEEESMVVASEVRSRYLNCKDRRTVFLFGDGACAFLLTRSAPNIAKLCWTSCFTLPSTDFEILVPGGGSATPFSEKVLAAGDHFIRMNDGARIVEATSSKLVETLQAVLDSAKEKVSDYDFFAFHQGNGLLVRSLCQNLGVPLDRTHINFNVYGNSSGASVGIVFAEAYRKKLIKPGDRVLMIAMGAGYHLGIASWRMADGTA